MNSLTAGSFAQILGLQTHQRLLSSAYHNYNNAAGVEKDCWQQIQSAIFKVPEEAKSDNISDDETSRFDNWQTNYTKYANAIKTTKSLIKNIAAARMTMSSAVKLIFKSRIDSKTLNLTSLSQDTINAIHSPYLNPNIKVINRIPREALVESDQTLVKQVLHVLVQNAIDELKDTGGQIEVSLNKTNNKTFISVYDSGKPIPEEIQKRMFQEDFTSKLETGNQGIGLSFAKKFAEALGGSLTYTDIPRKAFIFELPKPKEATTTDLHTPPNNKAPLLYPKNVILLEDREHQRRLAKNMLQGSNQGEIKNIKAYATIETILQAFKNSPPENKNLPTLIVTDWNLAYNDKLKRNETAQDLTSEIKKLWKEQNFQSPLPKIFITSGGDLKDQEGQQLYEEQLLQILKEDPSFLGILYKPLKLNDYTEIYKKYNESVQNSAVIS